MLVWLDMYYIVQSLDTYSTPYQPDVTFIALLSFCTKVRDPLPGLQQARERGAE